MLSERASATMSRRLSRWGIGPHIAVVALTYAALAGVATRRWPAVCRMRSVPYEVLMVVGGILLLGGVFLLVAGARSLTRAYNQDELVTSGAFALIRHPIYSAWIVFIVPGLALLARSWPLLITPLVACGVFKLLIHREDDYLQERFGGAFLEYRSRVNELIPIPMSRSRKQPWMRAERGSRQRGEVRFPSSDQPGRHD